MKILWFVTSLLTEVAKDSGCGVARGVQWGERAQAYSCVVTILAPEHCPGFSVASLTILGEGLSCKL